MTAGLPDYHQTVRPMYGGARSEYALINVGSDEEKSLLTITGKGKIYSGFIRMFELEAAVVDRPKLLVDDNLLSDLKYIELYDWGVTDATKGPLFLTAYDMLHWIYCAGIPPAITFENKVEIRYDRNLALAKPVRLGIVYALI